VIYSNGAELKRAMTTRMLRERLAHWEGQLAGLKALPPQKDIRPSFTLKDVRGVVSLQISRIQAELDNRKAR
jgi:hypothetical protein